MTRFARAKGSRASNERRPEEATSWLEIKQQMVEVHELKSKKIETTKPNHVIEENKKTEWAKFENVPKKDKTQKLPRDVGENSSRKKKTVIKWQDFPSCSTESESFMNNQSPVNIKSSKLRKGASIKKTIKKQPKDTKAKKKKVKKQKEELTKERNTVVGSDTAPTINRRGKKRKSQQQENPEHVPPRKKKNNIINDQSTKKMTRAEKEAAELPFKRKKSGRTTTIHIDGREVEIRHFDGFPVMKDDWKRLRQLKKKMLNEGIPKNEIMTAMKLERRRAEKALARERKKVCFYCRESAHLLSDCPLVGEGQSLTSGTIATGVCFKCGSTEHKQSECRVTQREDFKFAKCFVCGEEGHISRQCPDNPRGLYPKGGGCYNCGDVTHLRKDCPQEQQQKQETTIKLETMNDGGALEALDPHEIKKRRTSGPSPKAKRIKFM